MKAYLKPVLCFLCSLLFNLAALSQTVPSLVNYQGRLTDAAGQPLYNGTYRVRFELFDNYTNSANLIWGADYNVTLVASQFNVILGGPSLTNVPGAAVNDLSFA